MEALQWLLHLLAILLDVPLAEREYYDAFINGDRLAVCIKTARRDLVVDSLEVDGRHYVPSLIRIHGAAQIDGGRIKIPKNSTAALEVECIGEPKRVRIATDRKQVELKVYKHGHCPALPARS
ncbi:MAG: hypothetical protein ABWK05_04570 [Pyrobaculum sp.]